MFLVLLSAKIKFNVVTAHIKAGLEHCELAKIYPRTIASYIIKQVILPRSIKFDHDRGKANKHQGLYRSKLEFKYNKSRTLIIGILNDDFKNMFSFFPNIINRWFNPCIKHTTFVSSSGKIQQNKMSTII